MIITRSEVIEGLRKLNAGTPKNLRKKVIKPQGDVVQRGKGLPNALDKIFTHGDEPLSWHPSWSVLVEVPCPLSLITRFPP